jgi:hypothetical protein
MQHAVQPIGRLGALADEPLTMGDQQPQLTHRRRGHPDRRDESRGQQPRQMQRIAGGGLHPCGADQVDQQRRGDLPVVHAGGELVIHGPGSDGRFQDHLVLRRQVRGRPVRQSLQASLAWGADALLSGVALIAATMT